MKMALKILGRNKAPCPYGFTVEFFLKFWEHIKEHFISIFEEFYDNGRLNAFIQENFICLIQKEDVVHVKDFRPISLATSIYKVIAKVLVKRLKKVMPNIIVASQSAFIRGR